jgi:hypothetical protein
MSSETVCIMQDELQETNGIYHNSVSNKYTILWYKETTHPFHHFNPLAVALLIFPYYAKIMLDTNYITNSKCVDLGK